MTGKPAGQSPIRLFTPGAYLYDRAGVAVAGIVLAALVFGMLRIFTLNPQASGLVSAVVALFWFGALLAGYFRRRAYYRKLQDTLTGMDHGYYLTSLLPQAEFLEGRIIGEACGEIIRADMQDLTALKESIAENREFVELWTHEVKTPIAAAKLTLSRMHGREAQSLRQDIARIEASCEKALFNARESSLSTDFRIRETNVLELCQASVKRNADLLIGAGVMPVFEVNPQVTVLADAEWVRFALDQALSNSAKYGARTITFTCCEAGAGARPSADAASGGAGISGSEPASGDVGAPGGTAARSFEEMRVEFAASAVQAGAGACALVDASAVLGGAGISGGAAALDVAVQACAAAPALAPNASPGEESPQGATILTVADDGLGIPPEDLPHVFERGYSGSNGRAQGSSSGFGLYLAWRICARQGVGLSISSQLGAGTALRLSFPHDRTQLNLTKA